MFASMNCTFSCCKFLCFWPYESERRPAAVSICVDVFLASRSRVHVAILTSLINEKTVK